MTRNFQLSSALTNAILLCGSLPFSSGFQVVNSPHSSLASCTILSATTHHSNEDRIKKVGGGIPVIPAGNCILFDPEKEGKLQGTGALSDRISQGASYALQPSAIYDYIQAQAQASHVQAILDNDTSSSLILSSSSSSTTYSSTNTDPPLNAVVHTSQHWLEHLDPPPTNFAKPSNPVDATLLARSRIISPDAPGDIQHIVLSLPEGMHYVEGQSLSVIPPGIDPKTQKPYSPRLYSIASTRYGDALDGRTVSLCVRRAEFYDPVTGAIDPSKKGVCSNFLCDAAPDTIVKVAGPVGKTMLLPEDPDADVIMVATGTGIAPFRSFMHRLFVEETVARHMFGGRAWLVLGVPTTGGLLYREEIDAMLENAQPGQLQVDYAISREMTNSIDGGKLYVQNVIAQNAGEFFNRLDNGANVYFCGLKGMMPPILDALKKVAEEEHGLDWSKKLKGWKANHQWHVEVY